MVERFEVSDLDAHREGGPKPLLLSRVLSVTASKHIEHYERLLQEAAQTAGCCRN